MNKTSTVLLVSAAVVVGLVLSAFTLAVLTPYGHMLLGTPMWGCPTYGQMAPAGDWKSSCHEEKTGDAGHYCPCCGAAAGDDHGPDTMGDSGMMGGSGMTGDQ